MYTTGYWRKVRRCASGNLTCVFISIVLAICAVYPVRYPVIKNYDSVPESKIIDDIEMCVIDSKYQNVSRLCSLPLSNLAVFSPVSTEVDEVYLNEMPKKLTIRPGGRWSPPDCFAWQRVAIIVPYRNREKQLKVFLQHMHPFLQAQSIDYGIFIIEQNEGLEFNRGQLLNIGFLEASRENNFCCFIFHDVDLLPQSPRHLYACSSQPRHMCAAIDIFRYNLLYPELFGGVVAFTKTQFEIVNGYSNEYFGWGAEDDDIYRRVINAGMSVKRWESHISRYVMLNHGKSQANPSRFNLLSTAVQRMHADGLNSIDYDVLTLLYKPLYTRILVDLK